MEIGSNLPNVEFERIVRNICNHFWNTRSTVIHGIHYRPPARNSSAKPLMRRAFGGESNCHLKIDEVNSWLGCWNCACTEGFWMPLNKEITSESVLQEQDSQYDYLVVIYVTYAVSDSEIVDE